MKTLTIEVTQEDIDKGCRASPWSCPVALALERANGKQYSVGTKSFNERFKYYEDSLNLPEHVQDFILRFDTSKPVQPFSFQINIEE